MNGSIWQRVWFICVHFLSWVNVTGNVRKRRLNNWYHLSSSTCPWDLWVPNLLTSIRASKVRPWRKSLPRCSDWNVVSCLIAPASKKGFANVHKYFISTFVMLCFWIPYELLKPQTLQRLSRYNKQKMSLYKYLLFSTAILI